MRIVIEIQSGPKAGHKLLLREGQLLNFGRTEWADVVFTHDEQMAPTHFSLQVHGDRVRLCDLGSQSGTMVNQQLVKEAWLGDGDVVEAGRTRLVIWIDGGQKEAGARPESNADTAPAPVHSSAPLIIPETIECTRETSGAGLTRLRGIVAVPGQTIPPATVAGALQQHYSLTMLVHPQLVDQPQLASLPDAVPLYDWLPDDQARRASPLLLLPGTCPDITAMIDAAWDKNGLLCLFSRRPAEELVEHLRSSIRLSIPTHGDNGAANQADVGGPEPTAEPAAVDPQTQTTTGTETSPAGPPPSILGYCWPNVLGALVDYGQPAFMQRLFEGFDLVLLEIPDQPGSWQAVGNDIQADALANVGIRTLEAHEPSA